jgi:DNA-binding NtrC family response regulator
VVILRKSGYEARAFYDAESALDEVEHECPELVISDVVMPGMSGIEMAVLIRERDPACKVLLFSGHSALAGMLEKARQQGHEFEVLKKPVHPADLLAKIQNASNESEAELKSAD